MATQLLKARTSAFVISTASRPSSAEWSAAMGADLVIDHSANVSRQLRDAGIGHVDLVFSTSGTSGTVEAMKAAHTLAESGRTIGKTVIAV